MEDQVPSSSIPQETLSPEPSITGEHLAEMKRMALENAIRQHQAKAQQQIQQPLSQPQVVYVRRNLTVAELLLVLLLSCGIVTGVQYTWNFVSNILPRIEVRVK